MSEASEDRPTTNVIRSMVPRGLVGRAALVAAAVVVVVGGVTIIVGVPGSSPGHRTVAGPAPVAPGSPGAPGRVSATTLPVGSKAPDQSANSNGSNASIGSTGSGGSATFAPAGTLQNGANTIAGPPTGTGTPAVAPLPTGIVGQSTKVVTTATIDLAMGTDPIQPAVTRLTTIATGAGGFVAKSDLQVGQQNVAVPSSGILVLQIPQAAFASVLSQVQAIAKVTAMTSTSTDVTGQYIDLQARIGALQASRLQYLTILSKATSIGDILSVQSQLDTIQSQIEQLQGQLNLLSGQTTYATLTVSLSQSGHRAPPSPAPQSGIGRAWHQSVSGFTTGFEWLVRIAGRTLFVLLCLAVVGISSRWAWRAWRRQML